MSNPEIIKLAHEVLINEEDRVEATRSLSWTLGEFDDFPLFIELGDKGTVKKINTEGKTVSLFWDKDGFPQIEKRLTFEEAKSLKKLEK